MFAIVFPLVVDLSTSALFFKAGFRAVCEHKDVCARH